MLVEHANLVVKSNSRPQSLCDYSDAHILVTGTVRIVGVGNSDAAQGADKGNKPFTKCINQVNNTQTDDAERESTVIIMQRDQELYGNTTRMIEIIT